MKLMKYSLILNFIFIFKKIFLLCESRDSNRCLSGAPLECYQSEVSNKDFGL